MIRRRDPPMKCAQCLRQFGQTFFMTKLYHPYEYYEVLVERDDQHEDLCSRCAARLTYDDDLGPYLDWAAVWKEETQRGLLDPPRCVRGPRKPKPVANRVAEAIYKGDPENRYLPPARCRLSWRKTKERKR